MNTEPLKFHFEANQSHQAKAIDSIVSLFSGQVLAQYDSPFVLGASPVIANALSITREQILENLQVVQRRYGITPDTDLKEIQAPVEVAGSAFVAKFPNFSVEMETGTGKTYVYIRTALELASRYGMTKFIIVVPSIAIREGVLRTLIDTKDHFSLLFDNLPYRSAVYDPEKLTTIYQFAQAESVEFLVMTVDSFNKGINIIRTRTDAARGEVPLHVLQRTAPIVILDEPQRMETDLRIASIASLNPSFTLRYSATHRNYYNLTYRLTPYAAYADKLVKRIEVAGIEAEHGDEIPHIKLLAIVSQKRVIRAKLEVRRADRDGNLVDATIVATSGTDLEAETGRKNYQGFLVDAISAKDKSIIFGNGHKLKIGEAFGAPDCEIVEAQIRYTIEEHFRKSERLTKKGIKVLSLFFLTTVADYAAEDGIVRLTFDRMFRELSEKYVAWKGVDPASARAAYFAESRVKGRVVLQDSTSGSSDKDRKAYDLIMRNKAKLLSLDEPVGFIFSHSALREGWDSPNVFQICTLNKSRSDFTRRQEIGRGVRLAVDNTGKRVFDDEVNILTVIANENYGKFVEGLQAETVAEFGLDNQGPAPQNARKRARAQLRADQVVDEKFQELWSRIQSKTRYSIVIDTARLIYDTIRTFSEKSIAQPTISVQRGSLVVKEGENEYSGDAASSKFLGRFRAFDALGSVIDLAARRLEQTTPPIRVTRRTLHAIYEGANRTVDALSNPEGFASELVASLRENLLDQIVGGIRYVTNGEVYEATSFTNHVETWQDMLVPVTKSIYDGVIVESRVERQFALDLQSLKEIKLFIKLPRWFKVSTPVGDYIPDWAIVKEASDAFGESLGERLYLVRETKGSVDPNLLRVIENLKNTCGEKHFKGTLQVDYKVVENAAQV